LYLYALAAAGQPGVERIVRKLRDEIDRDMRLMGVRSVSQFDRSMLRWR
jgi:L-lactate dehydrogenase (cytochrome)